MRQYFSDPRFAQVGKIFSDLPVDAITQSAMGLNKAYSDNLARYNALELAMANMNTLEGDSYKMDEKRKLIQGQMEEFAKNGGFEHADAFVGSLASRFAGDQEVKLMGQNYQRFQEDQAIRDQLLAKGLTAIDARGLNNGMEDPDRFSSFYEDEFGNLKTRTYQKGYMQRPDYDPVMTKLFDQLTADGGSYFIPGPNGSKIKVTAQNITDGRIREYVANDALDRYKGSNEYKTHVTDLRTQGYTKEEADQIIKDQLIGVGMERVFSKTDKTMYGYVNPNTLKKDDVEMNQPGKFVRENKKIKFNEENWLNSAVKWAGLGGLFASNFIKDENPLTLPVAGESDAYVDPEFKDYKFFANDFWQVSGDGKSAKAKDTEFQGKLSHFKNYQTYVNAETGELLTMGEGSDGKDGKYIPENEEIKNNGEYYYVKDKDGNMVKAKPINVSMYIDEDGNTFAKKLDKIEEYRTFGPYGAVNSQTIGIGAEVEDGIDMNGARHTDYDPPIVDDLVSQLNAEPHLAFQGNEVAKQKIDELNAYIPEGDPRREVFNEVYGSLINKYEQSGGRLNVVMALNAMMKLDGVATVQSTEEFDKGNGESRDVQVLTPKGQMIARILNDALKVVENANIHKQNYKNTASGDVVRYNNNAIGEFPE